MSEVNLGRSPATGVRIEALPSILLITLDKAQTRNAINAQVGAAIADGMKLLDADDAHKVGVVTGAGGYFCSGFDLSTMRSAEFEQPLVAPEFVGFLKQPPRKPLIAAVEGFALGGGFEIVLACDIVVAARSASFSLPEVKRGLIAGGGGLLRLGNSVGRNEAMMVSLSGGRLSAVRAHALGLVNVLVDEGTALQHALTLARAIANNAPRAVTASKQIIDEFGDWASQEAFERQDAVACEFLNSSDAAEGAQAFLEKRAPRWTGK